MCTNQTSTVSLSFTVIPDKKLILFVILRWFYNTREGQTREEKAGFCVGRGRVDKTITVRWVLEHCFIFRRPAIIMLFNIRAAVDFVDRLAL